MNRIEISRFLGIVTEGQLGELASNRIVPKDQAFGLRGLFMLTVKKAEYAGGFRLNLTFSDGKAGIVDLQRTVHDDRRGVFSELKTVECFKDFTVDHDTVCWKNGLDLAPEYLYFKAFRNDPSLQDQFEKWGYLRNEPVPGM